MHSRIGSDRSLEHREWSSWSTSPVPTCVVSPPSPPWPGSRRRHCRTPRPRRPPARPRRRPPSAAAATADPIFPLSTPALAVGAPPQGTDPTTKSSTLNLVRYNRLYKTGPITPSKCKEVNVSMRTLAGVQAYVSQHYRCTVRRVGAAAEAGRRGVQVRPEAGLLHRRHRQLVLWCGHQDLVLLWLQRESVDLHLRARDHELLEPEPDLGACLRDQHDAHEYGHHIQYMTGILGASWARQRAFSTVRRADGGEPSS